MSPIFKHRHDDESDSKSIRSNLLPYFQGYQSGEDPAADLLKSSRPQFHTSEYKPADSGNTLTSTGSSENLLSGRRSESEAVGSGKEEMRLSNEHGDSRMANATDRRNGREHPMEGHVGMDEVDAFLAKEMHDAPEELGIGPAPPSSIRMPYILSPPSVISVPSSSQLIDITTPRRRSVSALNLPSDASRVSFEHTLDHSAAGPASTPPSTNAYPPSHPSRRSLSNGVPAFNNGMTHSSTMSLDLAKRFKDIVTKPFTPERVLEYSSKEDRQLELDGLDAGGSLLRNDSPVQTSKNGYMDHLLAADSPVLSPADQESNAPPIPTGRAIRTAQISLAIQATPSLLLSLVGLIFTGQLIDHLARWQVFKQVDELFILVPIIGNLKGNLEMCLAARLSTFAAQGFLDTPKLRHSILTKSLLSLQLQALSISALAGFLSFTLGFFIDTAEKATGEPVSISEDSDSGLPEYASTPGGRELVLMLATAMIAASLTSAILGGFMSWLIVACRWMGVDPDNVAAPLAACLGDLLTVFVLALVGTVLAQHFHIGLPIIGLVAAITATGLIGLLVRQLQRGEVTTYKNRPADQEQLGWSPLIVAMFLSCGTGLVLDASVNKYKGFALMGLTMTGVAGSIGAIHASRLSTTLHGAHHEATPMLNEDAEAIRPTALSAWQAGWVLFLAAWPVQVVFVLFAAISGWLYMDFRLLLVFLVVYGLTVVWSIFSAHKMTQYFWSKDLDPDSYTLPIHSALVDVIGQILLVIAFESAAAMGADVKAATMA